MSRVAVIGAGAWGTALAIVLGRKATHDVRLWAFEHEVCASIAQRRTNDLFLPGARIPDAVVPTNSLAEALRDAELVVSVMPSHHVRRLFSQMLPLLDDSMLFISATKGVEDKSYARMSEIIAEVVAEKFTPRIVAVSGPSFAKEVAKGDPTAITAASASVDLARTVQQTFSDPRFRVYTNNDVVGVELGGALKNVIAIAAGICDGLGLGHNSIAALITRGLAEITRLSLACGGRIETMAGLAGLGDLVLTCTGGLSRNRSVGVELGRGRKLPDIIAGMHGMVAEGVLTTNAALGLSQKYKVEMPITQQMHAILHEGKTPGEAIRELMSRPSTTEVWL
ncbi:MAG TPA: NAD(P)H-dependent glycerol-3-phosphate dehydrogenase [Candidatus Koribacter sp.]|jgi:glycerol-3-phosphate dehydrogenase (NAD(P)+)